MKRYVFDSYAILAFLEDGPGQTSWKKPYGKRQPARQRAFSPSSTGGEVYDTVMREVGLEKAELLAIYPLQITAADQPLTKLAAQFKGRHRIAYAACFAAALAKQEKAVVLTGDPEFRLLEKEIKVSWLR